MGNTPFWASTKPFPVTRANTNYLPPLWRSALNQCKSWTHWLLGSLNLLTSTYPPHFTQQEWTQRLTSLPYLVSSRTTQTRACFTRSRLMGGTMDSPSSAAARTRQLAGQKSKFTWQFARMWQFTNKWCLCPSLSNAVRFYLNRSTSPFHRGENWGSGGSSFLTETTRTETKAPSSDIRLNILSLVFCQPMSQASVWVPPVPNVWTYWALILAPIFSPKWKYLYWAFS